MLRKFLCLVILTSMILHCASRFGALSFLYEKRHSIAYSIGLIAEIPIAMCSAEYDFGKGLKIEAADSEDTMPSFAQAHEINLFFVSGACLSYPDKILLQKQLPVLNFDIYRLNLIDSIFHPPLA